MNIPIDTSKFEADNWTLYLNVKLTDEEMAKVSVLVNECPEVSFDEKGKEQSLPGTVWCIKQVRPDAEPAHWEHQPFNIYVRGLYLPAKVFEVENAMSLSDATGVAKETWRDQYRHLGIQATVAEARMATEKDMKKMYEIKEAQQ